MQTLAWIDNYELDLFIMKKMLSAYGTPYEVNCTGAGNKVIQLLSKNKDYGDEMPDIILLDIYMPGFDAWGFLDRLNWLYPTFAKAAEVFIISDFKYLADINRAKKYAFVKAFIQTPITKEAIQKLMHQKKAQLVQFAMVEACC